MTALRAIPDTMDAGIVADIDARLRSVEAAEDVRIPWAIESGSRAWGFPSPDSDYDCRFFFVRPRDAYLSLWPARDVIETPLDKIFDVNGWDLAKTLRLLAKGNATVTEWLRSPIVYGGDAEFRGGMLDLAEAVHDSALVGRHYLHVGTQQLDKYGEAVTLKRVFYALRPAATLRWLRLNTGVPPMNLGTLLDESDPPAATAADIARLIELKSVTREIGQGAVPRSILDFIDDELARARDVYPDALARPSGEAMELCNEYFRRALATY